MLDLGVRDGEDGSRDLVDWARDDVGFVRVEREVVGVFASWSSIVKK